MLRLRGRLLPIVSLPGLMASPGRETARRADGEGFIVVTQIGDSVLDGSVRTRLNQLRDAF